MLIKTDVVACHIADLEVHLFFRDDVALVKGLSCREIMVLPKA